MSIPEAALQAAAGPFCLLPVDEHLDPVGGRGFLPMRQQAMKVQRLGTGLQGGKVIHRATPSAGRRVRAGAGAPAHRSSGSFLAGSLAQHPFLGMECPNMEQLMRQYSRDAFAEAGQPHAFSNLTPTGRPKTYA